MEIWKSINELYMISNLGRVLRKSSLVDGKLGSKRLIQERILKHGISGTGYPTVMIHHPDGTRGSEYIHRLVAKAFIPNPLNKREVNHKNGIKNDFRIENLEWTTRSENQQHSYDIGISPKGSLHHFSKNRQLTSI